MTDESSHRSGQCLCGAVTLTGRVSHAIQICHCGQCQRWTGGGALHSVRVQDLELTGEEHIVYYTASEWGARGFCGRCGTTLFWKMQGKPPSYITPGLLEDQTGLTVTEEIFTDCRAPWARAYEGATQSTQVQEQEKLAAYLAQQ